MRRASGRIRRLCGALLLSSALVLCVRPASAADTLLVGAASSLREVVDALALRFEEVHPDARVRVSYGASSVLAAQLRAGAPLDVVLLADPDLVRTLQEWGTGEGRTFARNRLVVMVGEDVPAPASPAALGDPAIRRFALPSAAVPVGRYAREWLAHHALVDVVSARAVQTEHARATLLAVDHGHVDAAIVYETDARLARRSRIGLRIPDAEQPDIEYVALSSRHAGETSLAARWLDFLSGEVAVGILASAGFADATPVDAP